MDRRATTAEGDSPPWDCVVPPLLGDVRLSGVAGGPVGDSVAAVVGRVAAVERLSTCLVSIGREGLRALPLSQANLCRVRTGPRCLGICSTLSGGVPLGPRLGTPQRTQRNL